jgi:hypothetical protein
MPGAHLAVRWHTSRAVLRRWCRRAAASGALIGSAVVMTAAAGFVQWSGVPAAIPRHSAASLLLVALSAGLSRHGRFLGRFVPRDSALSRRPVASRVPVQ